MANRSEVFQKLKPHCIRLSQDAIAFAGDGGSIKTATISLEQLLRQLKSSQKQNESIDERIAEYVFWPLSHILKNSQKLPGRVIELVLECLIVIFETGWQNNIPTATAFQLLILLSFLSSPPEPKKGTQMTSEELQCISYKCLSALLKSFSLSADARKALFETQNLPTTGNCIYKILEGITTGRSSEIQLAAAEALGSSYEAINDQNALASFLPGIVSQLAKVLTPSTGSKRSYKVLVVALQDLAKILQLVISDELTRNLPSSTEDTQRKVVLSQSWLKATASQIRQALSNVIRLRNHGREDVREAMIQLCITVLDTCATSLAQCSEMMLDTLVALSQDDMKGSAAEHLQLLMKTHEAVPDLLKSMLHGWIVSLPRLMAAQNDDTKHAILRRISTTFRLLQDANNSMAKIERSMALTLRDSLTVLVKDDRKFAVAPTSDTQVMISRLRTDPSSYTMRTFEPVLTENSGQLKTIAQLRVLLEQLSTSQSVPSIAEELLTTAQYGHGESRLVTFWLAKAIIENRAGHSTDLSEFIDIETESTDLQLELTQSLYSLALSILTDATNANDEDWRLQALAVETIASQANQMKAEFRSELIEVLYPLLHLMGSQHLQLQMHALTCLNIVSQACEYPYVGDMIVQNADYLVNAVGLKLNSFDLSPQAPQVLMMMVKLSGPSLLPYIEDLIASIFSALETFHGYTKLVDLLFRTLRAISEEGAKDQRLMITQKQESRNVDIAFKPVNIDDIISTIAELDAHSSKIRETELPEPFPERAWGSKNLEDEEGGEEDLDEDSKVSQEKAPEDVPPVPRTYNLLLRVTEITQHYLPSSSPAIRTSLLSLLHTTIPALAVHENSFLPLINTLWPTLVPRLDDREAFIVANTLDVVSLMCLYGGNFMKSRIDDIWHTILKLDPRKKLPTATSRNPNSKANREIKMLLKGGDNSSPSSDLESNEVMTHADVQGSYVDSPSRIIWKSFVELVKMIIKHVAIDEEKYDEALDALAPLLDIQHDVRDAFERRNPDAVWLKMRYE